MHIRDGGPWLLDEHLDRMAGSARRLAIDLPDRSALAELVGQACAAWPVASEGVLRLVCTRGSEEGGPVTVFATVGPISPATARGRAEGLAVATASLGLPAGVRTASPWLLGGAKTLSYAVNMATLRWAATQGADDVLWVSTDGYALEAPTSSLVWLAGDTLCTVPPEATGILAGTTAAWLLDHAGELGLRAERRMVRPAELHTVDGVWLVSSVRGPAEVHTLDGAALTPSPETARIRKLLGY
jgi:4-amino-4-deoxychorismate lyase